MTRVTADVASRIQTDMHAAHPQTPCTGRECWRYFWNSLPSPFPHNQKYIRPQIFGTITSPETELKLSLAINSGFSKILLISRLKYQDRASRVEGEGIFGNRGRGCEISSTILSSLPPPRVATPEYNLFSATTNESI